MTSFTIKESLFHGEFSYLNNLSLACNELFINKIAPMDLMVDGVKNASGVFSVIIFAFSIMLASTVITVPGYAVPCTNWMGLPDNDCDGLANDWEIAGNYNGVTLPGADLNHKNIYLEIDYMQLHAPRSGVVTAVKDAFAVAPVSNPDGINGIKLWVDIGEQIPHQTSITLWSGFDTLKDKWFGTASERTSSTIMLAKQNTYHYALFIHQYNGGSSSGNS